MFKTNQILYDLCTSLQECFTVLSLYCFFYYSSCGLFQLPLKIEPHQLDHHHLSSLLLPQAHHPRPVHQVVLQAPRQGLHHTPVPPQGPLLQGLTPTQGAPLLHRICRVNIFMSLSNNGSCIFWPTECLICSLIS